MKWHLNPMLYPTNPEERIKQLQMRLSMLEMVKADLKSGAMTDWGICNDSSGGYAFAETDEQSAHVMMLKWFPYVLFDIKPVLTVDQCIADVKQAIAAAKK